MVRATAILVVCAVAAGTATAGEHSDDDKPVVNFTWSVAKDGALLVHPHPWSDRPDDPPRPLVLLGSRSGGSNRTFLDEIKRLGLSYLLMLWMNGGSSLAELGDIEHHFQMLDLGLSDEAVVSRAASPTPPGLSKPRDVRARLDRLLAARLCGRRGIEAARGALGEIARDNDADRLLRDAARQSLAIIDGRRVLDVATDLPPLRQVFELLPQDPDILIVVRPHRTPILLRPCRASKLSGLRSLRQKVRRLRGALNPTDIISAAMTFEVLGELNYEIARGGGNFRLDRVVAAGTLDLSGGAPLRGAVVMEGFLPFERTKRLILGKQRALERSKATVEMHDTRLVVNHPMVEVEVSEGRVILRSRRGQEAQPAGQHDGKWEQLQELGIDGDDFIWAYYSDLSAVTDIMPDAEPFAELKFSDSALIRASCVEGIAGSVAVRFFDEQAASGIHAVVKRFLPTITQGLQANFEVRPDSVLQSVASALAETRVERAGTSLTATIEVRDVTPEQVIDAFLLAEENLREAVILGEDDDAKPRDGDTDVEAGQR